MSTTVTMPQMGERVTEGEMGKWVGSEGERVEKDQPLVEILTDKADTELPSPASGVLVRIHAPVGTTVSVGDKLCDLDPRAEATEGGKTTKAAKKAPATESKADAK